MSYWEVHSLNNGVIFFADDCGLEESDPLVVQGRVVDGLGAGVDGAKVTASSTAYSAPATTTLGGGYYSLTVPAGTYKIAANTPGFKGSVNVTVSSSPVTAPDITLVVDPDYDPDLIFSARSTEIIPGAPWPTVNPAGGSMTVMGTPGVQSFGGVQWERNVADGPGYRVRDLSPSRYPLTALLSSWPRNPNACPATIGIPSWMFFIIGWCWESGTTPG